MSALRRRSEETQNSDAMPAEENQAVFDFDSNENQENQENQTEQSAENVEEKN